MGFNKASYSMRHGFGLSVLPGIFVTDCTLFYARLGYVNRNLKIATTEITIPNINKSGSGFRYGVGIKQSITKQFAIRLDYSQSLYKKVKLFGVDVAGGVTKNTTITPATSKFEIGMVYDFV